MSAIHDAERHLLWRPLSASDIASRIGMHSPTTIKIALDKLVGKGIAIRTEQPIYTGGYRTLYRRSICARDAA